MDSNGLRNRLETSTITPVGEIAGATKMNRDIIVDGKSKCYEYYYQTKSGPCAALTFANLWSLVHGSLPEMNIAPGLIDHGTSDDTWTKNFSLIHSNNPDNKDFKIDLGVQDKSLRQGNAENLIGILDTINGGSIVCGMKDHCNAIHRFSENLYVLVEPNNEQGLLVFDRASAISYIQGRFTEDPNSDDYFYFIGPDINPD